MLKIFNTITQLLINNNFTNKGRNNKSRLFVGEMMKRISIIVIIVLLMSGLIIEPIFCSNSKIIRVRNDLPDLTISQQNITISNATPTVGEPIIINATIWNKGTADATNVSVSFYEEGIPIGTKNVDVLVNVTWTNHIVDSSYLGSYSSIALDSNNGIHISYYDGINKNLKYAYKPSGGTWIINAIDSQDKVDPYISMAIDSLNGIHITYYEYTNNNQKYAYKPSDGAWIISTIGNKSSWWDASPSIAVDSKNGVYICYRDWKTRNLRYIYKPNGGTWTTNSITSSPSDDLNPSIFVDGEDGIHISYSNLTLNNKVLKYTYKPYGGTWTTSIIDNLYNLSDWDVNPSILVDSANGVHISYNDTSNDDLKYAYKPSSGTWTTSTIDTGRSFSMAVDSANGIHISYFDNSTNDLKYAYKPTSGIWTTSTIDSPGSLGLYSSIAAKGEYNVHISYYDSSLKYTTRFFPPRNVQVSLNWTPKISGLRNITVKIDENNKIPEFDETNNGATLGIIVNPGALTNISIVPSTTTLELNNTQQFNAKGYDVYNNEISILPVWEVSGCGTIDQNGLFTAKYPGTVFVYANYSNISGIATITILVNKTADNDLDGMLDWWEIEHNFNPFDASDAILDPDLDNLNNLQEFLNNTDPYNWDTDNDDIDDGWEVKNNLNPLDPTDAHLDVDNDSLDNFSEYNNGSDPQNPDTDADGLPDGWEVKNKLNFTNKSDSNLDPDIDNLDNLQEFLNNTDPNNWDTDNDDMADGWEVKYNLNPIDAKDASLDPDNDSLDNVGEYENRGNPYNPDSDGDSLPDGWEVVNKLNLTNSSDANKDPDLDGLSNLQEFFNDSNPQNSDTDGDNLGDGFEVIFSKTNPATWDSDGNGIGDGLEFLQKFGYTGGVSTLPNNWIGMTIRWSNYTMFVSTNSSVLEAEFDKEIKKLDILLSGLEGTFGACNISIPKSLINSTEDILIKLDGIPINFTIKQTKYNYYIIAKYKHSTHKLTADFSQIKGKPLVTEDDDKNDILSEYYFIIFIIIIIVIIIILIVAIRIRRVNLNNDIPQLPPEQLSKILEKKYAKGGMAEDTYKDIKSQLNKYKEK
ncbi:CARDB domain-containing protein [[Eubacterium] cellulosolvens]